MDVNYFNSLDWPCIDDIVDGGAGDDNIQGNAGTGTLRGMGGNDLLLVNELPEGDLIDGGDGIDTLQFDGGGSASITFSIADPSVALDLYGATVVNVEKLSFRSGSGNDHITGGALDDDTDGFDGDDWLDGRPGNDTLVDGFGTDTIYGGDGDDTILQNQDALIDGGPGIDYLRVEYYDMAGVTVDLSDPTVEADVVGTRVIGIERLLFHRLTGGIGDDCSSGVSATTSSSAAPETIFSPAATAPID